MLSRLFSYDKSFAHGQLHIPSADIMQIAELSLIRGCEIFEHEQYCDEITYVISGKATVEYNGVTRELTKGQIHYIKQGHTHRIIADAEQNFHYCCIGFMPNFSEDSTSFFFNAIQNLQEFVVSDDGSIPAIFNNILNETFLHDSESVIMLQCYFCQLLVKFHRLLNKKEDEMIFNEKSNSSLSSSTVYKTLKYIDKNYIKITTVKDVAKNLSYSEYYLSHIFKEKMGITLKEYILKKKIITAAELLKQSNMSVSDIAEHLHFSSLHSFGIAFKRYMNMSASDFRKS